MEEIISILKEFADEDNWDYEEEWTEFGKLWHREWVGGEHIFKRLEDILCILGEE